MAVDYEISFPMENKKVFSDGDTLTGRLDAAKARTPAHRMKIIFWILLVYVGMFCGLMMLRYCNGEPGKTFFSATCQYLPATTVLLKGQNEAVLFSPSLTAIRLPTNHTARIMLNGTKLIVQFKKLYVLSKLQNIDISFTEIRETVYMSKNSESPRNSRTNISGMRQEAECAKSVTDYQKNFNCSQLSPSLDNIFFLETSCAANQSSANAGNAKLHLSEKQACSIYSATHYNPFRKVVLLFTCPIPVPCNWPIQWQILFDQPNFFFGRVDMEDLYANTSLSEFYHGPLSQSKYPVAHQADVLRMFVSYLYGETYMDMDIISFKSLDDFGVNYVITQGMDTYANEAIIVNGIWNFEPHHLLLKEYMTNSLLRYDPEDWSTIGPKQMTETVKRHCNVTNLSPTSVTYLPSCKARVLPQQTFFTVPWWKSELYYESRFWPEVKRRTKVSHGIHFWSSRGGGYILFIGSKQPIIKFAEQHCPPIYHNAGLTLS